jgi:AraC-like DNA-binding protein
MELLVYTRLFREKFQKERFLCENDLLLTVSEGAFEVRWDGGTACVEANQAFHFFKNKPYERHILSPLTMALFRYQSENPIFDREHLIFRDIQRFRSTLTLANVCAQMADATKRREHLLWDLAKQYEIERESGGILREDAKMTEVEKRLRETIATDISIRALAEECGLSHVQMIRRFRSAFGHTPSEHLYALRLERAKELLLQTAHPVKKIARDCGFENEYYFSNFFKKHEGLSPSAYRAMIP